MPTAVADCTLPTYQAAPYAIDFFVITNCRTIFAARSMATNPGNTVSLPLLVTDAQLLDAPRCVEQAWPGFSTPARK
jgi:hypothetical protein